LPLFNSAKVKFLLGIKITGRGWEDNIQIDLQEVGCGGLGWVELAQGKDKWRALANAVMNQRVP
jgi:hypothetical protein